MARTVISFDPIAQPSGSFNNTLPNGCGTMRVKNASIVDLNILINNFASQQSLVQAGATVDIKGQPGYYYVYWNTAQKLSTNQKSIQSIVTVEVYLPGEEPPDIGPPLPRHFNPTNSGFGVNLVQSVAAANNWLALSTFNPSNSGVNSTFYAALYTSDGAFTSPRLTRTISDPNLSGVTVSPLNRNLFNPGGSQMHCTAQANLAGEVFGSGYLDIARAGQNTYNFIPFPDQVIATPGTGIMTIVQIAATTVLTQMEHLWTETPI